MLDGENDADRFTRRREERERAGWYFASSRLRVSHRLRFASLEAVSDKSLTREIKVEQETLKP